jgi:hypothetical protein
MTVKVANIHAHVQRLVSVVKMATVLECTSGDQLYVCAVFSLGGGAKGLDAKDIQKEMFPLCSRKSVSCKAVCNWVEKFSQERSKVADDARPGSPVKIATEATV